MQFASKSRGTSRKHGTQILNIYPGQIVTILPARDCKQRLTIVGSFIIFILFFIISLFLPFCYLLSLYFMALDGSQSREVGDDIWNVRDMLL